MKAKELIQKIQKINEAIQKADKSLLSTIYNQERTPDADQCEEDGNRSITYYAAAYGMTQVLAFLIAKGATADKLIADINAPTSTIKKFSANNSLLLNAAFGDHLMFTDNVNLEFERTWSTALKKLMAESENAGFAVARKNARRQHKREILNTEPVNSAPSSIPTLVESVIYTDNPSYAKQHLENSLAAFYDSALLKPLIDVLAVAAVGNHDYLSPKNKKLKILALSENKYSEFTPVTAIVQPTGGHYTQKNTLFISLSPNPKIVLGYLLHEGTHFIMQQVFNNECNPFFSGKSGQYAEKKMMALIKKTKELVERKIRHAKDEDSRSALEAIKIIFTNYPDSQHPIELAVKIPEIIGRLGVEKGSKWLERTLPELVSYHREIIIPAINVYLDSHKPTLTTGSSKQEKLDSNVISAAPLFQPSSEFDSVDSYEKKLLPKLQALKESCEKYHKQIWKAAFNDFLDAEKSDPAARTEYMQGFINITHSSWPLGIYAQKYLLIDSLKEILKRDFLSPKERIDDFQEELLDYKNFLISDERNLKAFVNYQKPAFSLDKAMPADNSRFFGLWSAAKSAGETFIEETGKVLAEIEKLVPHEVMTSKAGQRG